MSVLEIIERITSNRESGRLDINAAGTPGTLLFYEGKLVDARLGSLSGFQAVNAAVALRDAEVSFDHVVPAAQVSTITPSERVILSRFFGIEAADVEQPAEALEPETVWNPAPEPVVPLTPARRNAFAFFSRPGFVVVCFALLLGVAVGAVALRSRVRSVQQSSAVAVESAPSPVAESSPVPELSSVRESSPVTESSPVAESSRVTESQPQVVTESASVSPSNVRDLTGEWRVINTIEKTAFKSFSNMQVGFHLTINQNGNEFTASGEKFFENGQTLPVAQRTPIRVQGSIDGDKVVATFTEDGRVRRTNGRFVWKLQTDHADLAGTFVSNAAKSSGRSTLSKQQ